MNEDAHTHVLTGSISKDCFELAQSGARYRNRFDFIRTKNL